MLNVDKIIEAGPDGWAVGIPPTEVVQRHSVSNSNCKLGKESKKEIYTS